MPKTKRFKTYPFPYLADFSKDYLKTSFDLDIKFKASKGIITIQAEYVINNEQIQTLINDGLLKVVLKVVCCPMGYSKTTPFRKNTNSMEIKINSMDVEGDVDFSAFLIANQDFTMQKNTDFSKFWENETPFVKADNVIGESNERTITMSHLKSGTKKSIFKFVMDTSKEDESPYSVSLSDKDAIVFQFSKRMLRMFNNLKDQQQSRPFVYTAFIIPALSDILRQMINTEYDEDGELIKNDFNVKHCTKRWYMVLVDNYMKAFNNLDPTLAHDQLSPLEAAQTIIDKYAINNVLAGVKRIK